jgi:threonine dehydrogenase-like Zn-dependent dehydrogenase
MTRVVPYPPRVTASSKIAAGYEPKNMRKSDTMRAAVLVSPGRMEIRETPRPQMGPAEMCVRVESCGVCSSNVPPFEGRPWFSYPFGPGCLGHEACGRIAAMGHEVTGWEIGQRVAFLSNHAFAEYDIAGAEAAVPLPAELDQEQVPGEPLGCTMNIFRRARIERGDVVAIVGIGFLGALLTQLASQAGARVIAISRRPFALKFARLAGAAETLAIGEDDVIARVRELTEGRFCDVVLEAAGKQEALDLAGELTRVRGRLVVAGYHQDGLRQVNMQLWNWRGLDIINAHERDEAIYIQGIREAVEALREGRFHPRPLLTHILPLDRLGEALELTRDRPENFMKALVVP